MLYDKTEKIIELLKKEVVPALGCTEPTSVALAAAKARELLHAEPDIIEVHVSRNILKNGMAVGIPGTGMTGLYIAAALGACGGNTKNGLEVLSDVDDPDIEKAIKLVHDKKVTVHKVNTDDLLYVEVICRAEGTYARVIIKENHTISYILKKMVKLSWTMLINHLQ